MNTLLKSMYQKMICCSQNCLLFHIVETGSVRLLISTIALFFSLQSCDEKEELEEIAGSAPFENPKDAFEVEGDSNPDGIPKQGHLDGVPVTYELIKGQAIYQGDIMLTPDQLNQTEGAENGRTSAAADATLNRLWPDNTVYYTIGSEFHPDDKSRIREAINAWDLHTNLVFTESSTQANRIKFVRSDVSWSAVGMTKGEQEIRLVPNAITGSIMHEIGHAVGLFHEHSRRDRDNYVVIKWNNIVNSKRYNFDKYTKLMDEQYGSSGSGIDHQQFDFGSIMMYPSDAYAIDKTKPTMTRKNGATFTAQRNYPSERDFAAVNDLYPKPFKSQNAPHIAVNISAGADGTIYMVSNAWFNNVGLHQYGYKIYRWREDTKSWSLEQKMGAFAMDIAPDGTPWVVTFANEIYRKVGDDWEKVPGKATDIGIGADGTVYVVGTPYANGSKTIYKWNENSKGWTAIRVGIAVDVDAQGNPWIIDQSHNLWFKKGSQNWRKMGEGVQDITIDKNGGIFILAGAISNYNLLKWVGFTWLKQPGEGIKVAAGKADQVWVVKKDGTVHHRD